MCEGSTSCVRCGCRMAQIISGKKSSPKLPYTQWAGKNDVISAQRDKYGNPNGSSYDLLRDGSMRGYTILFINLCRASDSPQHAKGYVGPINALESKGFSVEFLCGFPSDFPSKLDKVCQLWVISGDKQTVTTDQINAIKNFYNQGKGVYLWADNDPYFADINPIVSSLFGVSLSGDYLGDKVVGVQKRKGDVGIAAGHLISTGIVNFYEGITISNVAMNQHVQPLVYSTDGKVVTAYSDKDGKRLLIDGGFTRLYHKWDSAGTDRYIVNAAGWLGNFERFGWKIPV